MKKFRKFTSLIGLILTVSILLCSFSGCDLVLDPPEDGTVAADIGKPSEKSSEKSTETDEFGNIKLQKEYCTATIDEYFADDAVNIQLFPEYENVEYKVEDFAEVGCVSIYEYWRAKDDPIRTFSLKLDKDSKENVLEMIKILEKREDVYRAYPTYKTHPDATPSGYSDNTSDQWAIKKLQLTSAWDINTGSDTVYVGVIDSGIDITHPDLAGRVDMTLSENFSTDFNTPFADATGHGTHVAGIIGAQWDSLSQSTSGYGGVCWNVKLVSLRVGSADGEFYNDAVAKAINYAEENGIKILNYSGGSHASDVGIGNALYDYSGIFICAAGNDSLNTDNKHSYPSCYSLDNIISVGASTRDDKLWATSSKNYYGYYNGSNYGATTVDLFAPGVGIYSCGLPGSRYVSKDGTSMATPFVTGVAALMLAEKPTLTPAQIKAALLSSVDQISAFSGKCVSGGRLNAYKALKAIHTDHSYDFSYDNETSSVHLSYCRCGDSITEAHTFTYSNNGSGTHKITCRCGYSVTEDHTYEITSSTVSCTQCSYSRSHSHAISYTSISPQAHKVTCDCGVIAYESHSSVKDGGVLRCAECGYGLELWSIDPPVTSQKYTLNEYR